MSNATDEFKGKTEATLEAIAHSIDDIKADVKTLYGCVSDLPALRVQVKFLWGIVTVAVGGMVAAVIKMYFTG